MPTTAIESVLNATNPSRNPAGALDSRSRLDLRDLESNRTLRQTSSEEHGVHCSPQGRGEYARARPPEQSDEWITAAQLGLNELDSLRSASRGYRQCGGSTPATCTS